MKNKSEAFFKLAQVLATIGGLWIVGSGIILTSMFNFLGIGFKMFDVGMLYNQTRAINASSTLIERTPDIFISSNRLFILGMIFASVALGLAVGGFILKIFYNE